MNSIPFNEAFEKALIVGVLTDPSLLPRVTQIIGSEDFYKHAHKQIFKTITELDIATVDSLTVQDRLDTKTQEYFKELVRDSEGLVPSFSNVLVYAEEVKSKSVLRSGINLGQEIVSLCLEGGDASEAIQGLESLFAKFIQGRAQGDRQATTRESFEEFSKNLGKQLNAKDGVRSGFFAIDMILHRLEGLIILAARPSVGKTALAINIARNVAETKSVLFFSLEQTQEQVFERMLATEAEVGLEEIRTGAFIADPAEVDRVRNATAKLLPVMDRVHVDERPDISASYITSIARQKKFEWQEIGLIIVDYLHIMRLNDKQKVDALGDAVKDLRALGKEIGCPVILLSQLSRQPENVNNGGEDSKRIRRRPELTDLRSSGEIEQSADVVIFLHRESYFEQGVVPDEDDIEVIVRKHRNGRTGTAMMSWYPKYVKFGDIRA